MVQPQGGVISGTVQALSCVAGQLDLWEWDPGLEDRLKMRPELVLKRNGVIGILKTYVIEVTCICLCVYMAVRGQQADRGLNLGRQTWQQVALPADHLAIPH